MELYTIYRVYWHHNRDTVDLGMYSSFDKAYEGIARDIVENYDDEELRRGKWAIDSWDIDRGWEGQHPLIFSVYQNHPQYCQTPEYIYEQYKDKEWS